MQSMIAIIKAMGNLKINFADPARAVNILFCLFTDDGQMHRMMLLAFRVPNIIAYDS